MSFSEKNPPVPEASENIEHAASEKPEADDVNGVDFATDTQALPRGYFTSVNFLGTMFAVGISYGCGSAGKRGNIMT